jgi:hypothetical protein
MDGGLLALLIGLGGAALTPVAIAIGKFVSQAVQLQTLKLGNSNFKEIQLIVTTAVSSSQQLALSGQLGGGTGFDKKANAIKVAKKLLEKRKIKVDDDILSELIEAQVWDAINAPVTTPVMPTTTTVTTTPTTTTTPATPTTPATTTTTPATTTTTTAPSTPPPQEGWTALGAAQPTTEKATMASIVAGNKPPLAVEQPPSRDKAVLK